jgi:hypothetical protein
MVSTSSIFSHATSSNPSGKARGGFTSILLRPSFFMNTSTHEEAYSDELIISSKRAESPKVGQFRNVSRFSPNVSICPQSPTYCSTREGKRNRRASRRREKKERLEKHACLRKRSREKHAVTLRPNRMRLQSVRERRTSGSLPAQTFRDAHCEPIAVPTRDDNGHARHEREARE